MFSLERKPILNAERGNDLNDENHNLTFLTERAEIFPTGKIKY